MKLKSLLLLSLSCFLFSGCQNNKKTISQSAEQNDQNNDEHEHNFVNEVVSDKYFASEATLDSPAQYYLACDCGEHGEETFLYGESLKPLKGLKIACLGDSITVGIGSSNEDNTYVSKLSQYGECETINLGVSGSVLCDYGTLYHEINRLDDNYLENADIVTMLIGFNDFWRTSNRPTLNENYYDLGNINSNDTFTIYGALKAWCNKIVELKKLKKYENTYFVWLTPLVSSNNNSFADSSTSYLKNCEYSFSDYRTRSFGYSYLDLINAIKDVAEYYDMPIFDLHSKSGIYWNNDEDTNVKETLSDTCHPNDKGYDLIAKSLARGLSEILTNKIQYNYKIQEEKTLFQNYIKNSNGEIIAKGREQVVDFSNYKSQFVNNNRFEALWIPNIKHYGKFNRLDYVAAKGAVSFYKVKVENNVVIDYDLIITDYSTTAEVGLIKTIKIDTEFEQDEYIGISGSYYWNAQETYYKCWTYTIDSNMMGGLNPQTFYFNISYDSYLRDNKFDNFIENRKNPATLFEHNFTNKCSDISQEQTLNNKGLIVNGLKKINRYYSLSDRTITYDCHFYNDTVALFEFLNDTSIIKVDVQKHFVQLGDLEIRKTNVLNGEGNYKICLTKYYNKFIIDIYSDTKHIQTIYYHDSNGGVGDGVVNYGRGGTMCHDYYAFDVQQSSFEIRNIKIESRQADVVFYGDSITEPESYFPASTFEYSWTRLMTRRMNEKAVVSGRGGTNVAEIMYRIGNELPYLGAKYCIITIGTNGGNTEANLSALIEYVLSLNIIPLLNHIPCYSHCGDAESYKARNLQIDSIREKYNIKGIDFDKATSINGDGKEIDLSTMWKENYGGTSIYYHHPNTIGALKILNQSLIDIPEVYQFTNN